MGKKLIIEIEDKDYERACKATMSFDGAMHIYQAIRDGIPLPKGHGRLGDLDAVMNDISTSINEMTNIGLTVDGDYLWAKLNDAIDNATTIIEADKENENE